MKVFRCCTLLWLGLFGFSVNSTAFEVVDTRGKADRFEEVVVSSGWTLVMLWAHDCIPCERQKPMIERFHKDTWKRGVTVLGLSTDPKSLRDKSVKVYESGVTSFTNYYYEGQDFSVPYGELTGGPFLGTPTYLLFNPDGNLEGAHTGVVTRAMLDAQFEPVMKDDVFTPAPDLVR